MSDNISPDEIKRRLVIFLRIPTEVWTDVLKLLPRKNLVHNIAPACFRLKEICDKNVKNIHVIENASQFTEKLENNDPKANQQLENLAADECQLAGQFKLSKVRISEKSQAILRHCPDLFNGCKIILIFKGEEKSSLLFLECLAELKRAKPIEIYVSQRAKQIADFWRHPTFLNYTRISLDFWSHLSSALVMTIFDWLHNQPNGVDCDGSAGQQVRWMIVCMCVTGHNHLGWLINRCSENIQQSQQPIDRRPFVLSFVCSLGWPGFDQFHRIDNKSTGEVLTLEMRANGHATQCYQLRRCLAEEEANGPDFYAGMFEHDNEFDEYKIGKEATAKVRIG